MDYWTTESDEASGSVWTTRNVRSIHEQRIREEQFRRFSKKHQDRIHEYQRDMAFNFITQLENYKLNEQVHNIIKDKINF